MIGGRLVLSVCYPLIVGQKLNIPAKNQFVAAIRPLLVSALLFAGAAWLTQYWQASSWPMLVLAVGATVIVTPLPVFWAGLPREVRRRMVKRIQEMLNSVRRRNK